MLTRDININHYESSYKSKSLLHLVIKRTFSFDQTSKSKINRKFLKMILMGKPNVEKVLEIGCGYGLNISKLHRRIKIFGIDISKEGIANCEKYFKYFKRNEARFAVADANEEVPFNEKYDIIICSHVLEHLDDDSLFLKYIYNYLAKEGTLLLNVPINEKYEEPNHVNKYTEPKVLSLLKTNNYKIIDISESDKWSLLFAEIFHSNSKLIKLMYKPMRAIFAIIPLPILKNLGDLLLKNYPNQQLIIVCGKQ